MNRREAERASLNDSSHTWSRVTADAEDPKLAPEGPARLFVTVDPDDSPVIVIHEARVTSYNPRAQPYADGTRAKLDLTRDEFEWLLRVLIDARGHLAAADAARMRAKARDEFELLGGGDGDEA